LCALRQHNHFISTAQTGLTMKKEQKKKPLNWTKVFIVGFGVFFAVAMVATYMSPLIEGFRTVKVNDTAVVGFTIRDAEGKAILTTDQQAYADALRSGVPAFHTQPLVVQAGKIGNKVVNPVPAYNPATGWLEYAILGLELDDISRGVVGMRPGEIKSVSFTFADPLTVDIDAEEFDIIGGNFTTAEVGDWVPMGFTDTPVISAPGENVTPSGSLRMAKITEKNADNLTIVHRYGSVDIIVSDIR